MERDFRFTLAIRIAGIFLAAVIAAYCLFSRQLIVFPLIFTGIGIALGVNLYHQVTKTNRDLGNFLAEIKERDFSSQVHVYQEGAAFHRYAHLFKEISSQFQNIRREKAAQSYLLDTLVEQVDVGIICFADSGEILVFNKAAQRLLNKPYLATLEGIQHLSLPLYQYLTQSHNWNSRILSWNQADTQLDVWVKASRITTGDQQLTVASLKNIRSELEAQELQSWEKLIRVLTHEIMNSVTPIASLSESLHSLLEAEEALSEEDQLDLQTGIQAIEKRSKGLMDFTRRYKDLAHVPIPQKEPIALTPFFEGLRTLLGSQLRETGVQLDIHVSPQDLKLLADSKLLEQVLINLIRNALEAQGKNPGSHIFLHATVGELQNQIKVCDEAGGIPPHLEEKIFLPFFTTKTEGSGIGLSLCKHIMHLHNGTITYQNHPGKGVCFTLGFER
ncbi:MAG: HAMP domain-containing sensor histidine kinase [Bacteroidota bacterium]